MKHVTFSGQMAPYQKGERRLLPDDVAADMERQGYLSASEPWPPTEAPAAKPAPSALKPERPILKPQRPIGTTDRRSAR